MNLSEIRLPLVRTLAFVRGATSTSAARHDHADTAALLDAANRTASALMDQLQTRPAGLTEDEVRESACRPRAKRGRARAKHALADAPR